MFSRRHYEIIARELHDFPQPERITLYKVADALAAAFKRDNPRFDRARFLKACGVGE